MSWAEDRVCRVIIGGAHSPDEVFANSFFQGTVFGQVLWKSFYADARFFVNAVRFTEAIFADDLNCWRAFEITRDQVSSTQVVALTVLRDAQHKLHLWAEANRVVFDTGT